MDTNSMGNESGMGIGMGSGVAGGVGLAEGSPAGALDYSGLLDAQGNFTREDWAGEAQGLSGKFKTLDGLVKSYQSLERMNSNANKVPVPNENSGQEEWDAFYERLGRPADPSGYQWEIPEELKASGEFDDHSFDDYKAPAHKMGLNAKQAAEVASFYMERVKQARAQYAEAEQQAAVDLDTELSKEWGPVDGPRWKHNVALARHGAKLLGLRPEDVSERPEGLSPVFYKALVRAAQLGKEGAAAALGGDSAAGGGDMAGSIESQISRHLNDHGGPYWNAAHPEHRKAVETVQRLFELKNDLG